MRHHTKTTIYSLLAIGLLLALFALVSCWIFLDSFSNLETRLMQTEVERARESIQIELDHLDTLNMDYSGWDDAYSFVQDGNHLFVKTNLADAVFLKQRLNLIVYATSTGKIVFSKYFDYRHNRELPLPDGLLLHLKPDSPLLKKITADSAIKGIITIPTGILMITSRPVLTSEYKGPAHGALIMARYLDALELKTIAERTKRSLYVLPLSSQNLSANAKKGVQKIFNSHKDTSFVTQSETISGYCIFSDIYGKDAFMLRIDSARSIFQQGEKTIWFFLSIFAAVIAISIGGIYITIQRLTATLRMQRESEERYHALVDQAAEGIILTTIDGYFILDANAAFASLTGLTLQEMRGCSLFDYFDGQKDELREEFTRVMTQSRELKLHHRSGNQLFAEVSGSSIRYQNQMVLSFIIHNVTERKNFEEQLMFQANHDPLTGLPNRNLLGDRLTQAIAVSERRNNSLVLLLMDLDHFKVINDTLGHSYGDQLLKTVSRRLQDLIRASDTIARIGGDEFVAVIMANDHCDGVITIARRILEEISKPYTLQGQEINITASIGISQYPDDGNDSEILFKKADMALYHVKEHGRNGIQFYADEMNHIISRRLKIESHLRHALYNNELSLHYQPQVHLASGNIVGMEALLRWTSSELGSVSPVDFIPVAESTGLIVPIGEWALKTACRQHKIWADQGLLPLRMAVNLSPRQFGQSDLVEMVQRILGETGIDATLLDLEVTESLMMNNVEDSIGKMAALKMLGVSLSIDDFGTGYSSLHCLQQFPLDILKVDRSFVQEIGNDSKGIIIRAIVAMAHSLGLSIIAEGVETVEQLNFLRNHRCEEVQGFYFSRPLPVDKFTELISSTVSFEVSACLQSPDTFIAHLTDGAEIRD